jgi:hypothetical protein
VKQIGPETQAQIHPNQVDGYSLARYLFHRHGTKGVKLENSHWRIHQLPFLKVRKLARI